MLHAALFGMLGAAVPQVLRIIAFLRSGQTVAGREVIASLLTVILGLGAMLFHHENDSALQTAVLGAAFPSIFSGLVAAASDRRQPSVERGGVQNRTIRPSLLDFLSWRF